ncbi:hypothetical protein GGF46_004283 [Coemansia sp. RSA 552]|nr:hypothetical protein GGF46_004283 [Coemansia sp. RSA 552]
MLVMPFLYKMIEGFDIVKDSKDVSFYAGLLFTSFSVCQGITTMYWGPLSDRIGRRPVILMGLMGDLLTFVLFGLSRSYKWAIITRSLNGLFAGNSAVVKSVMAEISDDTNRPRMMAILPLLWNVGAIAGSALGGILADPANQYPSVFGHIKLFHTFPYLLPCMVGSITTATGLVIGIFKLKETLVVDNDDAETAPLLREQERPAPRVGPLSLWSLLTPTATRVMAANVLMVLSNGMATWLYNIFAATSPEDGGLGFGPRGIGFSLGISSISVLYIQLVLYPRLASKYGPLGCFKRGLVIMAAYYLAIPWLSGLSASIEGSLAGKTFVRLPAPDNWMSAVGLKYGTLWVLLISLLVVRITGDMLAYTSINLIVTNIAPSSANLGSINGLQQLGATVSRIIAPLLAGVLWGWSLKHGLPYPFNSHLVWVLCAAVMAVAWKMARAMPASVNVYASGSPASEESED